MAIRPAQPCSAKTLPGPARVSDIFFPVPQLGKIVKGSTRRYFSPFIPFIRIIHITAIDCLALIHIFGLGHTTTPFFKFLSINPA